MTSKMTDYGVAVPLRSGQSVRYLGSAAQHPRLDASLQLAAVAGLAVLIGALVAGSSIATIAIGGTLIGALVLSQLGLTTFAVACLAVMPIIAGFGSGGVNGDAGVVADAQSPLALRVVMNGSLALGFVVLLLAVVPRGRVRLLSVAVGLIVLSEVVGIDKQQSASLAIESSWLDLRWLGIVGWGVWFATRTELNVRQRIVWVLLMGWNTLNIGVSLIQIVKGGEGSTRLGLPLVNGVFGHPTFGSVAATMLLCLVLADPLSPTPFLTRRQRVLAWVVTAVALGISLRFKPILGIVPVVAFLLLSNRVQLGRLAFAVIVTPLLVTSFALANVTLPSSGVTRDVLSHAPTRVLLLQGAQRLAAQNFPFGAGVGTFGARLSDAAETPVFNRAQIGSVYGFTQEFPFFRGDNLVAHVLGERGYIGFVLWVAALTLLVMAVSRLSPTHWFPATAVIAAVGMTPVLPSFLTPSDEFLLFVPAFLLLDLGRVKFLRPWPRYDPMERGREIGQKA